MGAHRRAVLLLDEPGQSLHPLAQRDLSEFFDNLAATNQLIYTAHSPFLVDADHLDRVRKVFVGPDGSTRATADLRDEEGSDSQRGAAYAVRAALTLSVAESMLLGSRPVLVAGQAEQIHLGTIRNLLIAAGRFRPQRELVFTPAGASRVARVAASLMTGEDGQLPPVLLSAGTAQARMGIELRAGLYAETPERVMELATLADLPGADVEDLFPADFLADQLDRIERRPETRLGDVLVEGQPFLQQAQGWAEAQQLTLPGDWRLVLARRVRTGALAGGPALFAPAVLDRWAALFLRLAGEEGQPVRRNPLHAA
jgi:hypothetical protein